MNLPKQETKQGILLRIDNLHKIINQIKPISNSFE